jgi:predicted short-subunit dehydrogenase-like oxidoreductase (DUF2520 family)
MHITIIGSGNVATHMAAALKNAGHKIVQVFSPNLQNASLLAYHVKAEAINDLTKVDSKTDLFLIAVNDDAISEVAWALAAHQKMIVHTSGATALQKLLAYTTNAGVFYPLQTFSKTKEVNFRAVPMCIEGADDVITKQLEALAQTISNSVYRISSDQRKILHLAAVFACNFPNYLYHIAQMQLEANHLPFDMLRPLIMETAEKVQQQLPASVQTGPAIRNDITTMNAHLQLLDGKHNEQQVYELLSQGIIKMDKDKHGDA